MNNRDGYINRITRIIIIIVALSFTLPAHAQESDTQSRPTAKENLTKFWNGVVNAYDFIYALLNDCDSTYVEPHKYNMALTPTYSYNYEHYRFSSSNGNQSMSISPDGRNLLGLYICWGLFSVGWSFDLQNSQPQTDFKMSLYSARVGVDFFYRESNNGYKIRSLSGFKESDGTPLLNYNNNFDGIKVKQTGVNVYYIFNKKFSYPAAYSQTTQQRRNAGSFILGMNYNKQEFELDHAALDTKIQEQLSPELMFNKACYQDLSINFGYSYNWVFAKNFLANISLTPAIGYKNTSFKIHDSKELLSSINFDFITRASIIYNNGKYYVGTSLVSNTYAYNKDRLSIINGFGIIKVICGFNFWRMK